MTGLPLFATLFVMGFGKKCKLLEENWPSLAATITHEIIPVNQRLNGLAKGR